MSIIDSWRFLFGGTIGVYDSSFNRSDWRTLDQPVPASKLIVTQNDSSFLVKRVYKVSGPSSHDREKMIAFWNKTYQVFRWTMNTLIGEELILGHILIRKWVEEEERASIHYNSVQLVMIVFLVCSLTATIRWKEQALWAAEFHYNNWQVNDQIHLHIS